MRFLTSSIFQGLALGLLVTQTVAAPNDIRHPTYDSLMKRDHAVRKDILRRSDPSARTQVWKDRVENYRSSHSDALTPEQSTVLDDMVKALDSEDNQVPPKLKEDAIAAFGFEEAKSIATSLDGNTSPRPDALTGRAPLCTCSKSDDWCADGFKCTGGDSCSAYPDDCGWWGATECDGQCYNT